MSLLFSAFPLAALIALAINTRTYVRKRADEGNPLSRSAWAWAIAPVLLLAFFVIWGVVGLLEGASTIVIMPIASAIIAACAAVSLRRDVVWNWFDAQSEKRQKQLRFALPIAIVVLTFLTAEVPFNSWMPFGGPTYFWLEMLLAAVLYAGLYFLGQRHAGLCGIGVAFFALIGIAQHFVKRFKNAAILPTDLLVLNTAAAVGKEYVFSLNEQSILGLVYPMLTVCALSLVRPPRMVSEGVPRHTVARNLGASALSFGLLAFMVLVPNYMSQLGVSMEYWYSIDYYQKQGFLPSFIAVMQDMPIRRPQGYSDDEAQRLLNSYADSHRKDAAADQAHEAAAQQFEQEKPTVIAVMNESFSDLSIYDGMHAGYEGPQFFKNGFGDALARGTLNVSVHGAGTCNTEFEFLTGNSLGFIGAGKYPYSIYDLSDIDALAAEFKQWGYDTCAIHPNYASNWNRDKIYPQMGFDQFLSIDDFGGTPDCSVDHVTPNEPHCEVFHSGVSDIETYNRILQMIEENDNPQFFFDVTMANHGSYNQNNIPADYLTHYFPTDFVGEETPERLNEYLSCIEKSDDDLEEFVGKLKELDRPVVLIFFGDHQPSISMEYNDYWYANEPDDAHARRAFSSNYVIWANYDVAGRDQTGKEDETSVDMLASVALDLMGAPVSDYQAAQLDIRTLIPSLSASDYQGADREWYVPDTNGTYGQAYHDMSLIEYLNFATKV